MTSHLRVTIDDIDLVLTEDTSISIELKNPYLNDGIDTYTYSFDVPLDGNRELLGDLDNPDSDRRLTSIEGHPMAIYIDGVLFAHGKVATIEEQTIVDKVSISMTSNKKQLKDMIGDLQLRDITFPAEDKADLQIGEKIGNIKCMADSRSSYSIGARLECGTYPDAGWARVDLGTSKQDVYTQANAYVQPQALGFSSTKEYSENGDKLVLAKDFINVEAAYKDRIRHPDGTYRNAYYHNARICYLHHDRDIDGKTLDTVRYDQKGYGPYLVLDADRQQSGICFYVMYVINVIFKFLDIIYDESELMKVEDLRRLSFFTTHCKYDIDDTTDAVAHFGPSKDFKDENEWLRRRNAHGALESGSEMNDQYNEEGQSTVVTFYERFYVGNDPDGFDSSTEWIGLGEAVVYTDHNGAGETRRLGMWASVDSAVTKVVKVGEFYSAHYDTEAGDSGSFIFECTSIKVQENKEDYRYKSDVVRMFANAKNLPEMSLTSFFDSLWGSFGLRFYYDSESNVVTPYFIRDILTAKQVHTIGGSDISVHKVSERITGVSMKYSQESERMEQINNVRNAVTDYDTSYDYLVDKTDNDFIDTHSTYIQLANGTLSAGDMVLYIDKVTGNAYRIKISKEKLGEGAIGALAPTLFQVAQFKGILEMRDEYKDLSDREMEETEIKGSIHEISSEFQPLVQNDLNAKKYNGIQILSPFIEDDMWNESSDMDPIRNVIDSNIAYVHYVDEKVSTTERYDVTGTDDGNSPLQHKDWGNCICVMRGGGANSEIFHFDRNYDLFSNEKWRMKTGTYCIDSDSIDSYGMPHDYNGTSEGIGRGDDSRFSLSIRAYQVAPADLDEHTHKGDMLCNDPAIARRGLADTFFAEYIYFILHRKKLAIKTICEIEHIIDMQWRDKYAIAGHTGWIDQLSVKVSVQNGIEKVEFTMFEL